MPIRYYLADVSGPAPVGEGVEPALAAVLRAASSSCDWTAIDARADATQAASGRMVVAADVTAAQHTVLVADARITYIPFDDASGTPVDATTGVIGDVAAANRTTIKTRLDAASIPTDDLTLASPLMLVVRRIARRCLIRQGLGTSLDFTEGLDTLISAIAAARRQAIATRLTALGFDPSVILGTDTVRQALMKLASQDIPFARALWGAATS